MATPAYLQQLFNQLSALRQSGQVGAPSAQFALQPQQPFSGLSAAGMDPARAMFTAGQQPVYWRPSAAVQTVPAAGLPPAQQALPQQTAPAADALARMGQQYSLANGIRNELRTPNTNGSGNPYRP